MSSNEITNGVGVDVVNVLDGPDRPGVEDPNVVVGFNEERSTVVEITVGSPDLDPVVGARGIPGTPNVGRESFLVLEALLWVRISCSSSSSTPSSLTSNPVAASRLSPHPGTRPCCSGTP